MKRILDVIDQADESWFIAIACRFFNIAATFFFPVFAWDTFDMWLIVFEVKCTEGLVGFEQIGFFFCQCFAEAWIGCCLFILLCLSDQIVEGRACHKVHVEFLRLLLMAEANARADSGYCTAGQAWKDILADQRGEQRALAGSGVADDFYRILAREIEGAARLGQMLT